MSITGFFKNKKSKKKKIGLALGGGAVLGAVHVGVLQAIKEYDIKLEAISGTSIGAFIAALYACGKTPMEIQKIAEKLSWFDITTISLSQLGLLSNSKFKKVIGETINKATFEQTEIPLAMVAADILTGEKVVLKSGDIATAVMASTCIPGVFVPVEHENRLLVDGGIMENVPVSPLKDLGADYIIGVDLFAKHSYKKPRHLVELLVNTLDITIMNVSNLQTREADVVITPDLSHFNLIDINQVKDLIRIGYREARKALNQHLKQL